MKGFRPEDTGVGRFVADEDVRREKQIARVTLDGSLRGVEVFEERTRPPVAQRVTLGRFHLDHVRTRIRQQFRAVGAGNLGRAVDHADAVEHQRAPRRVAVEQGVQATGRRMKD